MSCSRQPVSGYTLVRISFLPAALVFGLHLLAVTIAAATPVATARLLQAADWMLACSIVIGFAGVALMRAHTRHLRRHLGELRGQLQVALTDPVTGLPVRRVAEDLITATDHGTLLTVALADVDGLHDINHGPGGYATGDLYLTETGRRLRQAATSGDLVARLGGDEFVLITRRRPQQVAVSLSAAFTTPAAGGAAMLPLAVSIGICQLPGGDPHPLFGGADLAMLAAKTQRTGIEFYDPARDGRPTPPGVRTAPRPRSGR